MAYTASTLTKFGGDRGLPEMMWQASYGQGDIRVSWEAVSSYGLVPAKGYPVESTPTDENFGSEVLGKCLPSTNITVVERSEYPSTVAEVLGVKVYDARTPLISTFDDGRIDVVATFPVGRKDKARDRLEFLKEVFPQNRHALYARLREEGGFAYVLGHLLVGNIALRAYKTYAAYVIERNDTDTPIRDERVIELCSSYGELVGNAVHAVLCTKPDLHTDAAAA